MFKITTCQKCGKNKKIIINNNVLINADTCFDCVSESLQYDNLEHADYFCRTFNWPFHPDLWIKFAEEFKTEVFEKYIEQMVEEKDNRPNLYYEASTKDLWGKTNREWAKTRSFTEILMRLTPIKDSYTTRGRLKWGAQYSFEDLIKLDSLYTRTLKANNITNPMQKEAVKTLCQLQLELEEAIRSKDPRSIKDFSSAWSSFAKQADLEGMINETKTDDITTVAELYQYLEERGFMLKFHDGYDRDEVDRAIKDISEANRTLILESTGLQSLLEEMINKKAETKEEEYAKEVVENENLQDLLNFEPVDNDIETEEDDEVLDIEFEDTNPKITIIRKTNGENNGTH